MVKITGKDRYLRRLKGITGPELARTVGQALLVGGQNIQTDAQISITTGAVSGKGHVPSRPGEPPNNDTGVLAGNIEAVQVAPLRVEVTSSAPYAAALEYGTSKMAERPYMRPAAEKNRESVTDLVRQSIDHLIAKHGRR